MWLSRLSVKVPETQGLVPGSPPDWEEAPTAELSTPELLAVAEELVVPDETASWLLVVPDEAARPDEFPSPELPGVPLLSSSAWLERSGAVPESLSLEQPVNISAMAEMAR